LQELTPPFYNLSKIQNMGLKGTIFNTVSNHVEDCGFHDFEEREYFIKQLRNFFRLTPAIFRKGKMYEKRQTDAIKLIKMMLSKNDKESLTPHIVRLSEIEKSIKELEPWSRDHVVHALNTFLLGIYISKEFLTPRFARDINSFPWKICGLLHDIGYPLQIGAQSLINPFFKTINDLKHEAGSNRPDISVNMNFANLTTLCNNQNSFRLIQACITDWGLQIDAHDEFQRMIAGNKICHGIMSALTVLYVIDFLYDLYNPERINGYFPGPNNSTFDQYFFDYEVVPACAAIYIHNLPARCFNVQKIDPIQAPLAYLLKLSDTLQEWERPFKDNLWGLNAKHFKVNVENGCLNFFTDLIESKDRILRDINDTLNPTGITIIDI
jgi:hypothetical protein